MSSFFDPRGANLARVLLLAPICAVAACTPVPPEAATTAGVETVPLHVLARTIENHVGRTVRTCGRLERVVPEAENFVISVVDPETRFSARVQVKGCPEGRPRLVDGCITGRIAQENGTLEPNPDARIVASHVIENNEWWLHPRCRTSASTGSICRRSASTTST
jgi:hypothetical protein